MLPLTQSPAPASVRPARVAGLPPLDETFPGRWVGGVALLLGPLLLLTGIVLRLPHDFFFPAQLTAYEAHPARIGAAYSLVAAGNVALSLAVVALAQMIARRAPAWAAWGGTLVLAGLFARTFSAGVDHFAFQLVEVQSLEAATRAVADSYGATYLFQTFAPAKLIGWLVLALGAYRTGVLRGPGAAAMALMAALMGGTLKGSDWVSVLAAAGLCAAFLPLGVAVLRAGEAPAPRAALGWSAAVLATTVLFYLGGRYG